MLDKKYFLKGMVKLSKLFNKEKSEEELMLYYEYVSELTEEEFKYCVEHAIVNCDWFPTIKQLLSALEDLKPNAKERAREFESMLFQCDTNTLIRVFKKRNDLIAVKVLENNYKLLRELNMNDIPNTKAQLRNQYEMLISQENKSEVIKNNNLVRLDNNNLRIGD